MSSDDLICPFCFTIFTAGALDPDIPICRECNTFGRAIIVEPLPEFTGNTTRPQLEAMRDTWQKRSQFLEDERNLVLRNIQNVLNLHYPEINKED